MYVSLGCVVLFALCVFVFVYSFGMCYCVRCCCLWVVVLCDAWLSCLLGSFCICMCVLFVLNVVVVWFIVCCVVVLLSL